MKFFKSIIFYITLAFFLFVPIWSNVKVVNYLFMALMGISSVIYVVVNIKKIKIDLVDILFILFMIGSFLPVIFKVNVDNVKSNLIYFGYNAILLLNTLVFRRVLDSEKKKNFLTVLSVCGFIYFVISMIAVYFDKELMMINIFTYFGDQYPSSIDRFYGTMDYCNISALYFAITSFISLFKVREEKDSSIIFSLFYFMEIVGLAITYSKMVSLVYFIILIILLVYLLVRRKMSLACSIFTYSASVVIPLMLSLYIVRSYLINHNLLLFLVYLILDFIFFYVIVKILYYLKDRWKFVNYGYLGIILLLLFLFIWKPVQIPVFISDVWGENEYYITDFILDKGEEYEIKFKVVGSNDNLKYSLYKLQVENLVPNEVKVMDITSKEDDYYVAEFVSDSVNDIEYYMLKVEGINEDSRVSISSLEINGEGYYINTLFVPYTIYHQFYMIKYDKESVSSRFDYYKDSFKILKDYGFLLGHGYNSFSYYISNMEHNYLETSPHSYILELWLEVGIIGLIFIIGIFVLGIWGVWKNRNRDKRIIWFVILGLMLPLILFDLVFSSFVMKYLLFISLAMVTGLKFKF